MGANLFIKIAVAHFLCKKYGPGWMDGWMDGWMNGWMVEPG